MISVSAKTEPSKQLHFLLEKFPNSRRKNLLVLRISRSGAYANELEFETTLQHTCKMLVKGPTAQRSPCLQQTVLQTRGPWFTRATVWRVAGA
jgi:hypothetical protein